MSKRFNKKLQSTDEIILCIIIVDVHQFIFKIQEYIVLDVVVQIDVQQEMESRCLNNLKSFKKLNFI